MRNDKKMKKNLKMFIMCGVIFAAMQLMADTWTDPDTGYTWTYRINGDTAEIYKDYYSAAISPSPTGELTVPSTLGGRPVTSIGYSAFYDCSGLTSVTIPDGVTSIGRDAFYNCSGLTSVTIGNGVTSIGDWAFFSCSGLASVTIPNNVTNIGSYTFGCCTGLASVTIGDGVTSIGADAFDSCSGLTSFYVGENNPKYKALNGLLLTKDGETLVLGVNGDVTIPEGVTSISDRAFVGCSGLRSATIPDGVTSIGASAFYYCSGLMSVSIGNGVTSIGDSAFRHCSGLTNIVVDAHNVKYASANGLLLSKDGTSLIQGVNGVVVIPDGVTTIGDYAFYSCGDLREVTIPNSVTNIGTASFSYCYRLSIISIPDGVVTIGASAFSNCSGLRNVTIPDSVTSIGNYAFYYCRGLTSVTIPDSVTSIGDSAFRFCSGLTGLAIGDSVKNIGNDAFQGCSGLTSVTIPDGVTSIGLDAFCDCSGLTSVMIPSSVTSIGSSAFSGTPFYNNQPDGLVVFGKVAYKMKGSCPSSVTIPNSVTSIGDFAFDGCDGLTSVTIPDGVTSVGDSAFYGCSGLTSVTIPDSVTSIGNNAFYECSGLASVTIGDGVTNIDNCTFENCVSLGCVTIGNGVTNIGCEAFHDCTALTNVVMSDRVKSIDSLAFYGCRKWRETTICVSDIEMWCTNSLNVLLNGRKRLFVGGVEIFELEIPDAVTTIGDSAFSGFDRLTSISIPDSLTSIGNNAFYGCYNLGTIIRVSDMGKWCTNAINNSLVGERRLFTNGVEILDLVIPEGVTEIGDNAFLRCEGLASVVMPSSMTNIGNAAFSGCNGLVGMTVTDCLEGIGDNAFSDCNNLNMTVVLVADMGRWCKNTVNGSLPGERKLFSDGVEVRDLMIPDSVTEIETHAFSSCKSLASVTMGSSVTDVGASAFAGCSGLTNVVMSGSVTRIGDAAFKDCSNLPRITIPDGVVNIGNFVFSGCSRLADVAIPDGAMNIGNSAFSGCSSLVSMTIPNTVTNIGNRAFDCCSGLKSMTIPDSVTSMGGYAFGACEWLLNVKIGKGVTNIENGTFESCRRLSSISIGNNVTNIGTCAFRYCYGLTSVTIPSRVETIAEKAFHKSGLSQVLMPSCRCASSAFPSGVEFTYYTRVQTVSFDAHGGMMTTTNLTCRFGEEYGELPGATRAGYTFEGWKYGGQFITNETILTALYSHTLVAQWTANLYEIAFNANSGTGGSIITVPCDSTLYSPTVSRTGYTFAGWSPAVPSTVPPSNAVYTAQWTANKYRIVFDANGGSLGDAPEMVELAYDSAYGELPVLERVGYTFNGWALGGDIVAADAIVHTASDHTLVAQWTANEYEVTFNAAGGSVGTASKTVTFDSAYGVLPETSCEGYVFLGWFLGDSSVDAQTIVSTADDHTLTAKWGVQIGSGVWPVAISGDPIVLGAPVTAPRGNVTIPAESAGRPVARITAEAFAGNSRVSGLTIPATVEVEAGALGNIAVTIVVSDDGQVIPVYAAANVSKVVFMDGVTRISDNYFSGCTNLQTMDIAESVVRIGTNVFEAASALETDTIDGFVVCDGWVLRCSGNSVPSHGGGSTGSMILPNGVRGIAAGAFEGEYGIETVELPSTLRFIGAGAFSGCTGLEDIILPEGVVEIDRAAFRNCTYAQSLDLPNTLRIVGRGAFENCTSLIEATIPDRTLDIGESAFSNCWRMMSVTIPDSVTNVGAGAFADCRRLAGVTVPLDIDTMANLFPASYSNIASVVAVGDGAMVPGMFMGCAKMESLALPESLGEIPENAFVGCYAMTSFDVPEGVTNICARAFKGLSQLAAFRFPSGIVEIGDEAFSGCSGISALALPDGLGRIGARAFYGLGLLARTDIPASVEGIGPAAFGGCDRVRTVSMPGDVATVAATFPDSCDKITSATVVKGNAIDSLFEGCSSLAHVEMSSTLTAIGARAFAGCTALSEAGIPSGVTSLGTEIFCGCSSLSAVALPNGLSVLPDRAFAGCISLVEVVVPEGVSSMGSGVFDGCALLRSVRFVGEHAPGGTAAAYSGTDSALVTYVARGSMGWDGIPTSKSLPEFWPAGTTHEITWWEPNRFMVDFVADCGSGAVTAMVEQVTGTTYMLPPNAARRGAVFGGWWTAVDGGARVTAVTQVALTRPHTFYAHWTFNRYAVLFDANGGKGDMDAVEMTVATSANLPMCGFSRNGYVFSGWSTEPDGDVVYADAAEIVDLAYVQGASVTLYAVWEEHTWTLAEAMCEGGALCDGMNAIVSSDWVVDLLGGRDARSPCVRSGAISAAEDGMRTNTMLTATVDGEVRSGGR